MFNFYNIKSIFFNFQLWLCVRVYYLNAVKIIIDLIIIIIKKRMKEVYDNFIYFIIAITISCAKLNIMVNIIKHNYLR